MVPYVPWRDRAFVNIPTAAEILGRSRTWVEDQITARRLEIAGRARQHLVISVESLKRLVDEERSSAPPAPVCRRNPLRLVVNNHRREA